MTRLIKLASTLALLSPALLASACISEEELIEDELTEDELTETARLIDLEDRVLEDDLRELEPDPRGLTLCVAESDTFAPGDMPWHATTSSRPCVIHSVDLNRKTSGYPGGHWVRGDFPQYSGAWSLNDLVACLNSSIVVDRWDRSTPFGSWQHLANFPKTIAAVYEDEGGGIRKCVARYLPTQCGDFDHDYNRFTGSVRPNGTTTANGATVTLDASKGVDC